MLQKLVRQQCHLVDPGRLVNELVNWLGWVWSRATTTHTIHIYKSKEIWSRGRDM